MEEKAELPGLEGRRAPREAWSTPTAGDRGQGMKDELLPQEAEWLTALV